MKYSICLLLEKDQYWMRSETDQSLFLLYVYASVLKYTHAHTHTPFKAGPRHRLVWGDVFFFYLCSAKPDNHNTSLSSVRPHPFHPSAPSSSYPSKGGRVYNTGQGERENFKKEREIRVWRNRVYPPWVCVEHRASRRLLTPSPQLWDTIVSRTPTLLNFPSSGNCVVARSREHSPCWGWKAVSRWHAHGKQPGHSLRWENVSQSFSNRSQIICQSFHNKDSPESRTGKCNPYFTAELVLGFFI